MGARSLHIERNPGAGGTTVHYVDIKGNGHDHEHGDAALQADTRACKATAGKNVEACLADHGWKYTLTKYGPPLPRRHIVASAPQPWSVVGLVELRQRRRRHP